MKKIILMGLLVVSNVLWSATCNITLQRGWNLISTPFPETASSEIRDVSYTGTVFRYSMGSYIDIDPEPTLTPGEGYFILSEIPQTLTLTSDISDTCLWFPDIYTQWNMMGAPYNSIPFWNYELKYDYPGGGFIYNIFWFNPLTGGYDSPGLTSSDYTEKGKGYWILASDTMTNDSCFQLTTDGQLLWAYENIAPLDSFRTRCSPTLDDEGNVYYFTERTPAS